MVTIVYPNGKEVRIKGGLYCEQLFNTIYIKNKNGTIIAVFKLTEGMGVYTE